VVSGQTTGESVGVEGLSHVSLILRVVTQVGRVRESGNKGGGAMRVVSSWTLLTARVS